MLPIIIIRVLSNMSIIYRGYGGLRDAKKEIRKRKLTVKCRITISGASERVYHLNPASMYAIKQEDSSNG
jgi:hypothetical protein